MKRQGVPGADRLSTPVPANGLVVACIIDDLGTGGAQRIVTLMAREFASADVRMVVISLGTRDDEQRTLRSNGVEVHVVPGARLASPGRVRRLIALLRTLDPDLVHTHLLAAHVLGAVAARSLGIPVISTLHNVDPHPRFAGTWKRRAETVCLRFLSSRVLAVGPRVAQTNSARLGRRHIDVLANPLSIKPPEKGVAPDTAGLLTERRARVAALIDAPPSAPLLLTVGRLAREKGWPGFLDVIEALRTTHSDCRLLSVGDGPCHDTIVRQIAARGLQQHVHLLGRRVDVEMFYLGCDVFVLNSTIEGLPMALLEAMANGLPVVSTRVGDVAHAAASDVATLVEPGTPETVAQALRLTLDGLDEAQVRARTGRDRVLEAFDATHWARDLVSLYAATATKPARHRARAFNHPVAGPIGLQDIADPVDACEPEPLLVIEFVDGIKTGGAQALMALRARHAQRMGYTIHIVSLGMHDTVSSELAGNVAGIHAFPSRHVFAAGRLIKICALLHTLQPDVIITHLRTSNTVGAVCGRLMRIPVISTLHITFPEIGLAHARRDWAEKWALRLGARRVMAVGPSVEQTHRERLGGKPVEVIANPVELPVDRLSPVLRRASARKSLALPFDPAGKRIVLSVGRLTRVKGVLDSVQVIAQTMASRPDVRFVIVGDGELEDELRQCVESEGLQDVVFLLGRSECVREQMAASDVLLHNSYAEGLPLVLLEAMSMHLPIVATCVGDVPWLLGEGVCGTLIAPGDVAGTARILGQLLDSPGDAGEAVDRAFNRVRDAFSVDSWLIAVDRLLRDHGPIDRYDPTHAIVRQCAISSTRDVDCAEVKAARTE